MVTISKLIYSILQYRNNLISKCMIVILTGLVIVITCQKMFIDCNYS